jgi:hypothetical protein
MNVVFTSLPHMFDGLRVTDNHIKLITTILDYPITSKCPPTTLLNTVYLIKNCGNTHKRAHWHHHYQ